MRPLLYVMALGGSSLVQSSLVPAIKVGEVAPDISLVLTVLLGFRLGPEAGCLIGFSAGLLQDVSGGGLVGAQALTKALVGFGIGLLGGRFWVSSPLVQVPGLAILTLAEGLLRYGLLSLFHFPAELGALLLYVILPQTLYNGLLGAACVLGLSWVERRRGARA